ASAGPLGTVGWCFGGGWSLLTGIKTPVDATVVYYGNVARDRQELASLAGPVLGHYATQDNWINKTMVDGFEAAMTAAGKSFTSHWYEAHHAFANPTRSRYDEADAKLAWQRTLAFFDRNLRG
ncbi:MAG: dienelactone hydrolase family protein, partial [Cytophagales bacterium]|nr:dienelactone hydrolase family protein [Cytophagales bacterium]